MTAGDVCNRQVIIARPDASGILTCDDIIGLLSEELADLARLVVREQDFEREPAQPRR